MPAAPIAAGGNIKDNDAATAPRTFPRPDYNLPKKPGFFCSCTFGSVP